MWLGDWLQPAALDIGSGEGKGGELMGRQMSIPGLEPPPAPPKTRPTNIRRQITDLQDRVVQLELDLTLLRVQLEGDADHA